MEEIKTCVRCDKIFERSADCSNPTWEKRRYCSRVCVALVLKDRNKGIRFNTGRTHIKMGQKLSPQTQFKKGQSAWNKGMSNPLFQGSNNPNWRGGIYPEHLRIRHSPEMRRWREAVFERDNFTCVFCGRKRKVGDRVVLHADHIKSFAKYPELRLVVENGRTLCRECHLKTETHGVNLA